MTREELGRALREAAYLEGDFGLRSGRRSRHHGNFLRCAQTPSRSTSATSSPGFSVPASVTIIPRGSTTMLRPRCRRGPSVPTRLQASTKTPFS